MQNDQILSDLFTRAANGNTDAFSELVMLLEGPVYRFAYSIVGNREDAEDVSQDTFLRLFRSLGTYRGDASVMTYVLTVTKNTALDELRRRKSHLTVPTTLSDEDGEEKQLDLPDPDPNSNPANDYDRQERIKEVRQAITGLPDEARMILTLRDMEGRSYGEIAEVLGLNEGTVKSRLFRARQALKKSLIRRNIT